MSFFSNRTAYLHKITKYGGGNLPLVVNNDYTISILNYESELDMNDWCYIINSAYSDAEYNNESAKSFLLKHPFLSDIRTFFVCDSNDRIATISVGVYSKNRNVGGFCRIAVLPQYQRKGIGILLLSIGEKELANRNIWSIQEAILLKRVPSLRMHFSVGYIPEKNTKERACKRTGKWRLLIGIYDSLMNKLTFREYKKYLRGVDNKNHV